MTVPVHMQSNLTILGVTSATSGEYNAAVDDNMKDQLTMHVQLPIDHMTSPTPIVDSLINSTASETTCTQLLDPVITTTLVVSQLRTELVTSTVLIPTCTGIYKFLILYQFSLMFVNS